MEETDLLWGFVPYSIRWGSSPGLWLKAGVDLTPRASLGRRILVSSKVILQEKKKFKI